MFFYSCWYVSCKLMNIYGIITFVMGFIADYRKNERDLSMDKDTIYISSEDIEIINPDEYSDDLSECFTNVPNIAHSLIENAQKTFTKIENMLYSAPAFIDMIKASIPEQTYQAVLTKGQKSKIAKGALKLMTKKDGTLMANLVDKKTKKIVSTISLKKVKITPDLTQAITNYPTQMQIAQIAEQIQVVQIAIEEVRQGQEFDRLATAYSCQQKLLQAMEIKNPNIKLMMLLRLVADSEDSRNLLMQSQNANLNFIKKQPNTFWGKLKSGDNQEKIQERINEIRESLDAINMVSLVEALAYQEMGEDIAARKSLQYYANYIENTYMSNKNIIERLNLIDPSKRNNWSELLLDISKKIHELSNIEESKKLEGGRKDE